MTGGAAPRAAHRAAPRTARGALLGERSVRHGVADRPCADVREAVARTTAVQAQDTPASYLGVRSRAAGVTEADVVRAVEADRTVVRTWLMRGTIHLVDTADLRWLTRLIGPAIQRKYRTRWHQIGLTDDVLDASVAALPEILADGPLDRHRIRDALGDRGVDVHTAGTQAHTHAIVHACTTGLVCRGPDRGRTSTSVLTEDWVPDAPAGPDGDDALAELARRYFAAYSPATAADFGTWSGLAAQRAVGLIRDELVEVDVDGAPGFRLGEVEPQRGLRLLPTFDNYVIGYRDRAAIVDPAHRPDVYQGGMIRAVVLIDGAAAGTWRLNRSAGRAAGRVVVEPFRALTRRELDAIGAEADDVARFLGCDLALDVRDT